MRLVRSWLSGVVTALGIAPIPFEDLPEPLHSLLAPRVDRLGYLGEFFQFGAHQPER